MTRREALARVQVLLATPPAVIWESVSGSINAADRNYRILERIDGTRYAEAFRPGCRTVVITSVETAEQQAIRKGAKAYPEALAHIRELAAELRALQKLLEDVDGVYADAAKHLRKPAR